VSNHIGNMNVVIPLTKSKTDFLDLRYVLRAIERHGQNVGEIFIIGERPQWIKNVKHIQQEDNPRKEWKERNIYLKAKAAFDFTDRYLFMNDDHVLLADTDLENYPNYYKGTCYQSMLKNSSHYRQTMNQTKKWLDFNHYQDRSFDGHCPLIMEKRRFLSTMQRADWTQEFGYGMKSLYCAGLEGEYMLDGKISTRVGLAKAKQACSGRHVISFTDAALLSGLGEHFADIFKEKSRYEI